MTIVSRCHVPFHMSHIVMYVMEACGGVHYSDHSEDEIYIPTSEDVKDQTDTTQETGRQQAVIVVYQSDRTWSNYCPLMICHCHCEE